ncbi:hypothetical protein [Brachybacterium huguangmaarense]
MPAEPLPYVAEESILRHCGDAAAERGKRAARLQSVSRRGWEPEGGSPRSGTLTGEVDGSAPAPTA